MAMTDAMDEVDYVTADFNQLDSNSNSSNSYVHHAANLQRHPPWLTEAHYIYHLYRDGQGRLVFVKDKLGEPVCSPRKLRDLCQCELVSRPSVLEALRLNSLPSDLYPRLLTEAILQRQLRSVAYLVSIWPFAFLHIQSIIPSEELLWCDYLTVPLEGSECMSLMDSLSVGLLNQKPHSRLKCVNFTGFPLDRRLCRELMRLPIVWMKPAERQAGFLHSFLRKTLSISKDKVQRYLNRISCIYSNLDMLVRHGNKIGPITIVLDCKTTIDDVPIGLVLQNHSPFRYVCHRVWHEILPDVGLPLSHFQYVFQTRFIQHLEIEDSEVCSVSSRWESLLEDLVLLPQLESLSLPNTVHVTLLPTAVMQLSDALQSLGKLRKLSLPSCTLRESLDDLLSPLTLHLSYLNLRDTRLGPGDLRALCMWPGLSSLRELNLARNNLGTMCALVVSLLPRIEHLTCLSVSFCSLSIEGIRQIVRRVMDCVHLKVLCIQSFIPPPSHELRGILEDCSNIPTLQKCVLLPEAYAFPGTHISQRNDNRHRTVSLCSQILDELNRPDIQLE